MTAGNSDVGSYCLYLVIWKHNNFSRLYLGCTVHFLSILYQETPFVEQEIVILVKMQENLVNT